MKVNKMAIVSLFIVSICQMLSAIFSKQTSTLWLLALPLSAFDMIAYTAILTAYSDAVDKTAQGWVMGISGAIMAISWACTGLCANLLPIFGAAGLILAGAGLLFLSALCMMVFNRAYPPSDVSLATSK